MHYAHLLSLGNVSGSPGSCNSAVPLGQKQLCVTAVCHAAVESGSNTLTGLHCSAASPIFFYSFNLKSGLAGQQRQAECVQGWYIIFAKRVLQGPWATSYVY